MGQRLVPTIFFDVPAPLLEVHTTHSTHTCKKVLFLGTIESTHCALLELREKVLHTVPNPNIDFESQTSTYSNLNFLTSAVDLAEVKCSYSIPKFKSSRQKKFHIQKPKQFILSKQAFYFRNFASCCQANKYLHSIKFLHVCKGIKIDLLWIQQLYP